MNVFISALIKRFLSWYLWVPLSRLSYGLYLTHAIIISRGVFVVRNPQDNDYFNIVSILIIFFYNYLESE